MMVKASHILIVMAFAVFAFSPAVAQPNCGPRAEVIEHLHQKFGERPVLRASSTSGRVMELLVSEARSWTVLLAGPNGISCIADAGEAYDQIDRELAPGQPSNGA